MAHPRCVVASTGGWRAERAGRESCRGRPDPRDERSDVDAGGGVDLDHRPASGHGLGHVVVPEFLDRPFGVEVALGAGARAPGVTLCRDRRIAGAARRPRCRQVGLPWVDMESPALSKGETMTTLENRPYTALLVVDVQQGVVDGNHQRDTVVANVGSLVEKARQEQIPVIWVQHSDEGLVRGSEEWLIVPELAPGEEEPLVEKNYGDSFEDTTLEAVLSGLGVGRLVVVGAQTDACIRSTLHGAFARGYDATLVSDAHTTEDQTAWGAPPPDQVIAHTNLYWTDQRAPGRTAGTVETKNVDFGTS
jgi:isochorismate hydrolase